LIIIALMGALKKPGLVTGVFILGYGLSRYAVEFFRQPDEQFVSLENPNGYIIEIWHLGVSMGQLLSLPMVLVGLIFLAASLKFKKA
jgi:phosphatidylglycerol:prolipoprotein diacylglycerol transferase